MAILSVPLNRNKILGSISTKSNLPQQKLLQTQQALRHLLEHFVHSPSEGVFTYAAGAITGLWSVLFHAGVCVHIAA